MIWFSLMILAGCSLSSYIWIRQTKIILFWLFFLLFFSSFSSIFNFILYVQYLLFFLFNFSLIEFEWFSYFLIVHLYEFIPCSWSFCRYHFFYLIFILFCLLLVNKILLRWTWSPYILFFIYLLFCSLLNSTVISNWYFRWFFL